MGIQILDGLAAETAMLQRITAIDTGLGTDEVHVQPRLQQFLPERENVGNMFFRALRDGIPQRQDAKPRAPVRNGRSHTHLVLQIFQIVRVDRTGIGTVIVADLGRHADDFPGLGQGQLDPDGPERHVRDTHRTSAYKQIGNILRIQAAVRHVIAVDDRFLPAVGRLCRPGPFAVAGIIVLPGIMHIHRPGRRETGVREDAFLRDVVLIEDEISDQAPGLPLHADVLKVIQAVIRIFRHIILQIRPIAKDRPEEVVPDQFGVQRIVRLQAGLPPPDPLGCLHMVFLIHLDRPRQFRRFRESAGIGPREGVPHHGRTHLLVVRLIRSGRLIREILSLAAHHIFSAGQIAHRPVTGAIHEQGSRETVILPVLETAGRHAADPAILHIDLEKMQVVIYGYSPLFQQFLPFQGAVPPAVFSPDQLLFARCLRPVALGSQLLHRILDIPAAGIAYRIIMSLPEILLPGTADQVFLVDRIGIGIVLVLRIEAGHLKGRIAQIGIQVLESMAADRHLHRPIAAQPGQIVHQGDVQAIPGGCQGRRTAGQAAADNNQIQRLGLDGIGQMAHFLPPVRDLEIIRVRSPFPAGEPDGVRPSFETAQVLQNQGDRILANHYGAGILPAPGISRRTQDRGQGLPVDRKLEGARSLPFIPGSGPVVRAHIHVVAPALGETDLRPGIFHRTSRAVGQEIRGLDLFEGLVVGNPAALVGEGFRLDQDLCPGGKKRQQGAESAKKDSIHRTIHNVPD